MSGWRQLYFYSTSNFFNYPCPSGSSLGGWERSPQVNSAPGGLV